MAALTPSFWSFQTHSYFQDIYSQSPGSSIVIDMVRCILLSTFTVVLAVKSATILKLLRRRRSQGERSAGVYAVISLVLFALFAIGTILYCTKVLLALKEAMCAVATWDIRGDGVQSFDWIKCRGVIRNGFIHDQVDKVLSLIFALNAQVILSIVNGILVRHFRPPHCNGIGLTNEQVLRVRKVFSDIWMVYVPVKALYDLWVVISFVEMYTILRFDWDVPVHPRLFKLTFNELMHLSFALSFIFNLLVTVLIATRRFLQLHGKSTVPEGGSFPLDNDKRPGYNKAKILLVDAALPVTLCSLVMVIAYSRTVLNYTNTALYIQAVFAILWLVFSVMAPHLIAIHHLRAEVKEFARKAETAISEKLRDSLLDTDAVAVKTLAYSQGELKI
ncbi:hypothetical protein EST38_g10368 [Candolleomyces aberdarensis]|uniref:Uncharacterized protein n=1 Tax=Candolleomyces aberdarensis TaxID=2316362 RepID=A0A4Q2DA04_9AGAR|nr:hypothetical protein EST38_g10368 [Candolleomyces aberdarensis]